jgi:predicted RNase H-like HicB family nuclease
MKELIFLVEEAIEGGYTANALGESIITEGDTLEELKNNIKEAVELHFEDSVTKELIS